jgi:uncharacterized protein YjeT (DUF2065 family)
VAYVADLLSWSDLAAAFALYLVLEGIMPFVNPSAMRRFVVLYSKLGDAQLRIAGLVSMLAGLGLLYFARGH